MAVQGLDAVDGDEHGAALAALQPHARVARHLEPLPQAVRLGGVQLPRGGVAEAGEGHAAETPAGPRPALRHNKAMLRPDECLGLQSPVSCGECLICLMFKTCKKCKASVLF